jgi:hypothetical protein
VVGAGEPLGEVGPLGDEEPPGAGVLDGLDVSGAGVEGAGAVVLGVELGAPAVSSFLSQAVSATAITEARIKVLLIMMRLLLVDNVAAPKLSSQVSY